MLVERRRAAFKLLHNYQKNNGCRILSDFINRWAPPIENDTNAYVNHVCQRLGVNPKHPLDFDSNPQIYLHLARAIAYHENGSAADRISLDIWKEGANLAGLQVEV